MKSFSKCFSKVLMHSTAVALIGVSSFSALAMDEMERENKVMRAIPLPCKPLPFELNPTGAAVTISREDGKIRVITDHNNHASYELEHFWFKYLHLYGIILLL